MTNYAFAMPLLPGKTEAWKGYVKEMKGNRSEEYSACMRRSGLNQEQVWLQQTPKGDLCVVCWETENPNKVFEHFMKSNEPYEKWFREKILTECHGLKSGDPIPPMNTQIIDNKNLVGEKVHR